MEHCLSGDPIYDFALFDYYYSAHNFLEQLVKGYPFSNIAAVKRKLLFYETLIAVGKLAWKHESGHFLDTIEPSVSLLERQIRELLGEN